MDRNHMKVGEKAMEPNSSPILEMDRNYMEVGGKAMEPNSSAILEMDRNYMKVGGKAMEPNFSATSGVEKMFEDLDVDTECMEKTTSPTAQNKPNKSFAETSCTRRRRHSESDIISAVKVNVTNLNFETRAALKLINQQVYDGGRIQLLPNATGISAVVYPSHSNKRPEYMALPKQDDRRDVISQWLAFVDLVSKIENIPSLGVILNSNIRRSPKSKKYEENIDYSYENYIDSGSHGTVIIVSDNATENIVARKSVKLKDFNLEEVLCQIDLEQSKAAGSNEVPWPILFGVQYNPLHTPEPLTKPNVSYEEKVVYIFTEYLNNARTLEYILHAWKKKICYFPQRLINFFPVYLVEQLISGIERIHGAGWVHRDLHFRNIMLQPMNGGKLRVIILDFGRMVEIKSIKSNKFPVCQDLPLHMQDTEESSDLPQSDFVSVAKIFMSFRHHYNNQLSLYEQLEAVEESLSKGKGNEDTYRYLKFLLFLKEGDLTGDKLNKFISGNYGELQGNLEDNLQECINILFPEYSVDPTMGPAMGL